MESMKKHLSKRVRETTAKSKEMLLEEVGSEDDSVEEVWWSESEYPDLEGTHKNHSSPTPGSTQNSPQFKPYFLEHRHLEHTAWTPAVGAMPTTLWQTTFS